MTNDDRRAGLKFFSVRAVALFVVVVGSLRIQSSILITITPMSTSTENHTIAVNHVVHDKEHAALPPFDFETVGSSSARAFPSWPADNPKGWCIPDETQSRRVGTTGLLYVKTPKTGSSTIAGIVRRIAISQGQRSFGNNETVCGFRNHHTAPIRA